MSEYGSFCPVSKAADVLCERWSILVVRELLAGSTRFVELRRGLPACPAATLSKRLKQLEAARVVERVEHDGAVTYELTAAGRELFPIVQAFGEWGQRWVRTALPTAIWVTVRAPRRGAQERRGAAGGAPDGSGRG